MRLRRVGLTIFLAVLVTGGLFGAACGSSSNNNTPTPQKTAPPAATATKAAGATTAAQVTPTKAATSATTAAAGSPTAAGTPVVVQMASVTIHDFQFTPATVTLKVGSTVIWLNDGPSTHDVTADDGSFKSGSLATGKTYSHTFSTAGTFDYHCSIHPSMKGQIVIGP